jgi:hypothetical protein
MKVVIFKSAQIGAIIGFLSALGYAVLALIIVELFLPFPNPAAIAIFGKDFSFLLSEFIIPTSPFWLFGSTIIGVIATIGFSIYLVKVHPSEQRFVHFCTLASTIIVSPLLLITIARPTFFYFFNGVYHPFINPIVDTLLETGFPSLIFILAGFLASHYLYKNDITRTI